MRISTAVVCTLAVLAAREVNQQAIASPDPSPPDPSPDAENGRIDPVRPLPVVSMTAPEVIPIEQRFDGSVRFDPVEPADRQEMPPISPEAWAVSDMSNLDALNSEISGVDSADSDRGNLDAVESAELQNGGRSPDLATMDPTSSPDRAEDRMQGAFLPPPMSPEAEIQLERVTRGPENFSTTPSGSNSHPIEAVASTPSSAQSTDAFDESEAVLYQAELLTAQTPAESVDPASLEQEVRDLQQQLQEVETIEPEFGDVYEGSPAITIMNPSGYGADNFTGFLNFSYQTRTRYSEKDDGTMGIGIGFGDAQESVGLQLSYTMASFGSNRDFGTGGFNAKLHRQFGDGWSVALGWEGFLNIGDENDFEHSIYGAVTHIIRTQDDLDDPFSRIALTAGVGNGRFRTEEAIDDGDETVGVFGSMAVRIARPLSAIVEWTGQDLAVGLSITPIRGLPWVITPALRDITGAGDGSRFVIGTGISFRF